MELEYCNGVRITQLHHEKSPLDAAIDRYQEMAQKHYQRKNTLNANLTKEERKKELEESLRYLEHERRTLDATISVQAQLAAYRENAMSATRGTFSQKNAAVNRLNAEAHHPTKLLEKFMRAEGQPKPTSKHTAHHIVPGAGQEGDIPGRGQHKKQLARARVHLHQYGIGINDPANGVYLLTVDEDTPHWTMPKSTGHRTYHTGAYEQMIHSKIVPLKKIDMIKTQLQLIGRILQANEPKHAVVEMSKLPMTKRIV